MGKESGKNIWKILFFVFCPIVIGSIFLAFSIREYRNYDIKVQDQGLEDTMSAVDGTLTYMCDHYISELNYITGRPGFIEAEKKWMETGEANDLLQRMKGNLIDVDPMFRSILMVYKGRVLLSTDGKMDYWLPVSSSQEAKMDITVCSDESLLPYIAFVQYKEGITYAAIMDPILLYQKIEETSGLKVMGDMILTDKENSLFLYRDETEIKAEMLNDEGQMENPLLHILLYANMKQLESIDFYEVKEGPYKESYNARVAICPSNLTKNGHFSLGILHNEDMEIYMMQRTALKIILSGGLIFLGIIILLYYLLWIYRQDESYKKEIHQLLEKKEAMEALNEQTKELAHHQRLETIGQLTSGIAHEFNNLLTPIMGYSIMTMENINPEDTESYDNLLEIYEAANKAKTLISRLSDLSRKNNAVTMHYINPNEIVRKALSMVATNKPKEIEIIEDFQCSQVWILGNEVQMIQMFMNLFINAIHAIGEKEGKVIISDYVEKKRIFFKVTDSGEGMKEEVKKKIFEPFFTTKEQGRGTGLGLAIVMQTVEAHKGHISVESSPGAGTTFTLDFPMAELEEEE